MQSFRGPSGRWAHRISLIRWVQAPLPLVAARVHGDHPIGPGLSVKQRPAHLLSSEVTSCFIDRGVSEDTWGVSASSLRTDTVVLVFTPVFSLDTRYSLPSILRYAYYVGESVQRSFTFFQQLV